MQMITISIAPKIIMASQSDPSMMALFKTVNSMNTL